MNLNQYQKSNILPQNFPNNPKHKTSVNDRSLHILGNKLDNQSITKNLNTGKHDLFDRRRGKLVQNNIHAAQACPTPYSYIDLSVASGDEDVACYNPSGHSNHQALTIPKLQPHQYDDLVPSSLECEELPGEFDHNGVYDDNGSSDQDGNGTDNNNFLSLERKIFLRRTALQYNVKPSVDNNLISYHLENLGRVRQRDYVEQKKLIDKHRGYLFQTTLINQTSHLEDHYTLLESNLSTHSSVPIGGVKIKQRNIKYEPQSTGIDIIPKGRTSKDEFTALFSQKNNNMVGPDLGSAQILQRDDESTIKPPMEPTFCSKQDHHKNSRDSIYPPHCVVQSSDDDNGSDSHDNSTLCSTPPKQKNKRLKQPKSMARAQYETTTVWIEEDKGSRRRKSKSQIKQQFETIFANVASLSDERDDDNVNISHNRGDSDNGECDNGPSQKRLEKRPKKFKMEKEKEREKEKEKESEEVKNNRRKGQKGKKPKKYSKLTLSQFPPLTKITPFTNRPAMSHWRYNLLPDFCMNHRHIAKLHLTFMKKRLSFAKIYSYLEKNNLISKDYFQTINPQ
jgi:hypothetical protein